MCDPFFLSVQGVQERANLTSPLLSKEDPIFSSLSNKLGRSVDEVGHRIHQGLMRVRSACTTCFTKQHRYSRHLFPSLQILEESILAFTRFSLFFFFLIVSMENTKISTNLEQTCIIKIQCVYVIIYLPFSQTVNIRKSVV